MRFWKTLPVPGNPLVSLVVAAYTREDPRKLDALCGLIYALRAQTYEHWEAILVHDGPNPDHAALVARIGDPRIRFVETPVRRQGFGHPWRSFGIALARGAYVGLSNGDNYYVPVYFEAMLHPLVVQQARFAFCDLVHSHRLWQPVCTRPEKGSLDLGAWIADAALVKATPWVDFGFAGDGTFIDHLVAKAEKVVKVNHTLFVHS